MFILSLFLTMSSSSSLVVAAADDFVAIARWVASAILSSWGESFGRSLLIVSFAASLECHARHSFPPSTIKTWGSSRPIARTPQGSEYFIC